MKKIISTFFVLMLICPFSLAKNRDILYTVSGSEFTGELIRITENEIVFISDGAEMVFPADSVRSIDLGTWRPGDDWHSRFDVDDPILLDALDKAEIYSDKYKDAGWITLYEKCSISIDADSTATIVTRYIYYIANESGKNKANYSETYFSDCQSVSVDFARSIGLSKISTVADNAIEDGSTNSWLADYQRERRKKFALTGASLGSVIDFQVTKKFGKIDVFNGFFADWNFFDKEPIILSEFEVRYHKNIDVKINESKISAKKNSTDRDYKIKLYRMENIEPYVEETMLPDLKLVFPNVMVSIPCKPAELSSKYHDKIVEALDDTARIKAIINKKYPAGKPSIEQIYNFVSENYASNWIGMRNYYPYPKPLSKLLDASRVASHEICFLLFAFLRFAGYDAELVMVGPVIDSPIPREFFNISHFNYLKVRVKDGDIVRYLSPNEYLPFDHQELEGVYILPIRKNYAGLERIERFPPGHAHTVPRFDCKLFGDGTLTVKYSETYYGPMGGDGYRYRKHDKPRELDNFFDEKAKEIDELATLENFELTGYKSLNERVKISYSVKIPGFAITAGDNILAFKLPTVEFNSGIVGAEKRTLPFAQYGNIYSRKEIFIELPEGYEIEHIPKSLEISVGYCSFIGDINLNGRVLEYTQIISGKHMPIIDKAQYPKFKEFIEKRTKFAENWILLRKKS